jgi:hypothetical protein
MRAFLPPVPSGCMQIRFFLKMESSCSLELAADTCKPIFVGRASGHEIEIRRCGSRMVVEAPVAVFQLFETKLAICLNATPHLEAHGFENSVSHTRISDHGPIEFHSEDQVISHRIGAVERAEHPPQDARDLKSNLFERPTQQAVQLIEPTAAAPNHDLLESTFDIQIQRAPELDIEILIGDGEEMLSMDFGEAGESGSHRPVIFDSR